MNITVRATSTAAFPDKSLTLYRTVYVPAVDVTTVELVTIFAVITPSTLSLAVAPASTYASPTVSVTEAEPISVITGGVVSAADKTFTVRVTSFAALPDESVTL